MKLLLIEDNIFLRKTLVDYLREEGFAVDSATDGDEGLHKAETWEYDVVLLDVMLPGRDGWEILETLRSSGKTTPVIMLTARDQLDDRLRGLNGGADDYLVKPFEMEELVARVRSAIRRNGGTPSPVIQSGPVTLNTVRRTVSFEEDPVELTATEYALLEVLMMRRNEVVSRTYIYERLFDENDDSVSNMVDVYIYRLRQKLGKDRIQTRRGMGYVFVE